MLHGEYFAISDHSDFCGIYIPHKEVIVHYGQQVRKMVAAMVSLLCDLCLIKVYAAIACESSIELTR